MSDDSERLILWPAPTAGEGEGVTEWFQVKESGVAGPEHEVNKAFEAEALPSRRTDKNEEAAHTPPSCFFLSSDFCKCGCGVFKSPGSSKTGLVMLLNFGSTPVLFFYPPISIL